MPGALAPRTGLGGHGCWESGHLAGHAPPSLPLPAHRRSHRSPRTSPGGPRASSKNRNISRNWVRVLEVAGLCRDLSTTACPGHVRRTLLPCVSVACPRARWAGQVESNRAVWALPGQQQIKVKTMKPPAKIQVPREEEEQDEEEPRAGGGGAGGGQGTPCGCTGSHLVLLLLVSAIPSPSPHGEEATDTRGSQSCTRG